MSDATGGAPGPEQAASALRLLLKSERALRAYPAHNEISQKALAELVVGLQRAVPLELELTSEQVLHEGTPLLDPGADRSPLVAALWRDGVRRLHIGAGVDADEIRRLAAALATPVNPDSLSEDYVTVLWGADLPHVRVMAIDPYLVTDVEEDVLEGRTGLDGGGREDAPADVQLAIPPPPLEAFVIRGEDARRVAAEIEREAAAPPWATFIEAMGEALTTPEGDTRAAELTQAVEATLQRLIVGLCLDLATRFVRRINETKLSAGARELMEAAWARSVQAERLAPLHVALEAAEVAPRDVAALLLLFRGHASPALCALLSRARSEPARRLYLDVLADIGRPAVGPALALFRTGTSEARQTLARLLGRLRDSTATEALVAALPEASPSLRHALVSALAQIRDPLAIGTLLDVALDDADAASRKMALRGLGEARVQLDPARLLERLRSTVLTTLDEEEKDLLFVAAVGVGGDQAVPFLRSILAPGWLPGLRSRADRRRAAAALARLATPEAIAVLERFSRSLRRRVARVCAAALKTARPA